MKGQIMIIDLLFFTLITIFVLFIIINSVYEIKIEDDNTKKNIKELEEILFVEKLVSDCDFFAYTPLNRKGLCYKNILEIKLNTNILSQLEEQNVCRTKIGNNAIYDQSPDIKKTFTRGVIHNGEFKIAEISFC